MKNLTFITGGARSGKSQLAQELACQTNLPVYYLATMMHREGDQEQERRIAKHKLSRPEHWQTIECGSNTAKIIRELEIKQGCVILDCLSLFVSGFLIELDNNQLLDAETTTQAKTTDLITAVGERPDLNIIIVSNEVGSGVVPELKLGRAFRDALGCANQIVAKVSETAYLCVSGMSIRLK